MTDANDEPAATEPDKPNQTPPTPAGSPEDFSLRGSPPLVTRLSRKAMAVTGIVAGVGIGGSLIYALQQRQPVASPQNVFRGEAHTKTELVPGAPARPEERRVGKERVST